MGSDYATVEKISDFQRLHVLYIVESQDLQCFGCCCELHALMASSCESSLTQGCDLMPEVANGCCGLVRLGLGLQI